MSANSEQTPVSGPKPEPAEEDLLELFDDETEPEATPEQIAEAVKELDERCKKAGISVEEVVSFDGETEAFQVLMPSGREKRSVRLYGYDDIRSLLDIPFEKYTFLTGYEAICSYSEGSIANARSKR